MLWRAITRRWHRLALTTRLTVIWVAVLVAAVFAGSAITIVSLRGYLLAQMDAQLITAARVLTPQIVTNVNRNPEDLTTNLPIDYYVVLQRVDGTTVEAVLPSTLQTVGKPKYDALPVPNFNEALNADSPFSTPQTVDSTIPGATWRITSIPYRENGKPGGLVTVAHPLVSMNETIHTVTFTILLSSIILVGIGSILGNFAIFRALRPLRQIESVAGKIAAGDLTQRVPQSPRKTEIGSLSYSLNRMLASLEAAFNDQELNERKMRRFVSDASHELRTPTAAIRGYAELFRMGGVPAERTDEVMGRIESEATRMGNLVQDLLALARLDEGRPLVPENTNLTELARGALSDFAVLDPSRDTALIGMTDPVPSEDGEEAEAPDAPEVWAIVDKEKISQLILNLLSNVLQHTPEGVPVEIAVGYSSWPPEVGDEPLSEAEANRIPGQQRCAVIEVRDHGPGIPAEDAEKVFERFYRADESRSRASGGSGLGLAIVSGVVSAHGGVVKLHETPGGGATVQVKLPCEGLITPEPSPE